MSVDNPSDSGGGGVEVAFSNPPSMADMGAMGSWAEIMAEEQVDTAAPSGEKHSENHNHEEHVREIEDSVRKPPKQPSYAVQVANLPACSEEELFYYFGGDNIVRDVAFLPDRQCAARIDLFTLEGLRKAKELDGEKFRGRVLKVYEIREDRIRERPSHEFYNRQYSNEPAPYNREKSRYNSQSSLHSNDARNFERNRPYNSSNDYRNSSQNRGPPMGGTYSRSRFYNNYDDYNNGRKFSGDQSCRGNGPYYQGPAYSGGGYPPRSRGMQGRGGGYSGGRGNYYGSQELSRSDNYHHDEREKPPIISRSRTESNTFDSDRRRVLLSRTSSRLSTSTEEVDTPVPRVKKLTNKDIFGEAKPVDTSERLREIEARQEQERLLEQQKYKEEAEAARLAAAAAAAAEHSEGSAPSHQHQHQHQYGGGHNGHFAHHSSHHQYHHAPSRPPAPHHSHPSYGLYQSTHGVSPHSQQSYTSSSHFQQQYDVSAPTSYRIMRRDSADPTDASPPLDPVHTKVPLQSQTRKEIDEGQDVVDGVSNPSFGGHVPAGSGKLDPSSDRRNTDDVNTATRAETLPRSGPKHRVYCNPKYVSAPLQKSATMDEIREPGAAHRGRGGRGGRGRGFHRGGSASDRRSSFSGLEKVSGASLASRKPSGVELEGVTRRQSTEVRSNRSDRKDHQGSHASLRGGRTGTLRRNRGGGGGYLQERTLRVSREEDEPLSGVKGVESETRKEQPKLPDERLGQPDDSEEKASTPSIKKDTSKTASTDSQATLTSSTTSVQDRKKEKKKANKKETAKGGKTLNNNKFALLVDSED
ncbi:hypothetical protein KIN20_023039 [Parelaphostrongylus tenuis]|uniref:RRM domain-containing protein n=1 Tax=Parelaphostrongylus tenuis TaxID=148309 RepID=A0AAD5QV61_PARTN|nr:hypothetical protein KIN20_023039 [Parelaphostrongylus tenuis]